MPMRRRVLAQNLVPKQGQAQPQEADEDLVEKYLIFMTA
jgi:hypothetical protein